MNFKDLKKSSNKSIENLMSELDKMNTSSSKYIDERYWSMPIDEKTVNGTALIRFLPVSDGDKLPWVILYSHGFQGPGGWYIENSLTTLGKTDPVSEYNTVLWNSGIEANKEIARKQKRKLTYIANILVISDAKRPQNEGKVFLYKFGKKIFDKIKEKLEPQFEDEKPLNPFDFWKGANFKVKIRNVEGYRNYDKSEFDTPAPLFDGDDAKIEKVWKSEHSLKDFLKPENFKTYDELKAKLDKVLGAGGATAAAAKKIVDEETYAPVARSAPAKKATAEEVTLSDDDDMSFFEKLAAE